MVIRSQYWIIRNKKMKRFFLVNIIYGRMDEGNIKILIFYKMADFWTKNSGLH